MMFEKEVLMNADMALLYIILAAILGSVIKTAFKSWRDVQMAKYDYSQNNPPTNVTDNDSL